MTFAPWRAVGEGIYFLPPRTMLYHVELADIVVHSSSKEDAYLVALSRLRSTPEDFIIAVYDEQVSDRPLSIRLVTGN